MTNQAVRNGTPRPRRNDRNHLDMYRWPDGRWIRVHDDGHITVGQARHDATAKVINYRQGNRGSIVIITLAGQDDPA